MGNVLIMDMARDEKNTGSLKLSFLTLRRVDKSSSNSASFGDDDFSMENSVKLERLSSEAFLSMAVAFAHKKALLKTLTCISVTFGPITRRG